MLSVENCGWLYAQREFILFSIGRGSGSIRIGQQRASVQRSRICLLRWLLPLGLVHEDMSTSSSMRHIQMTIVMAKT